MIYINTYIDVGSLLKTDTVQELAKVYLINLSKLAYSINKNFYLYTWIDVPNDLFYAMETTIIKILKLNNIEYIVSANDSSTNVRIQLFRYKWQKVLFTKFTKHNTFISNLLLKIILNYSDTQVDHNYKTKKIIYHH